MTYTFADYVPTFKTLQEGQSYTATSVVSGEFTYRDLNIFVSVGADNVSFGLTAPESDKFSVNKLTQEELKALGFGEDDFLPYDRLDDYIKGSVDRESVDTLYIALPPIAPDRVQVYLDAIIERTELLHSADKSNVDVSDLDNLISANSIEQ